MDPRWKIAGVLATLVIVLSPWLYLARDRALPSPPNQAAVLSSFVGSESCRDCHKTEYDKWKGSHHERAMDLATDHNVLGDFNGAVFEHFGRTSRFYKKDGKFFVHTMGPEGKAGDFEITHTFGWHPLQQYLVPFPGGRLQCLPLAWDVKDKRWFHLYPDQEPDPDDWLYWTNAGQNWNGMCAECHSTNLKKNYDPVNKTFDTTWSDINVGCEACHGPGSRHVAWARFPAMGRPRWENTGLLVNTRRMDSRQQNELCAPCHSRRTSLSDNEHQFPDFMDYAMPQLLNEDLYFADGQILDEVYVYGSFMQSKMYQRSVRCSDCHDVHSIRRHKKGNQLCLQCHKARDYDTYDHHFHKKPGEPGEAIKGAGGKVAFEVGTGAQCEQCHMPGRVYMGVDYRPDHSFRVPRPDLTIAMDTPNACNRCHGDKDAKWSQAHMEKWYGKKKKPHYGEILAAGRKGAPAAKSGLMELASDRLFPAIARATALNLLGGYPPAPDVEKAFTLALADEQPLVRHAAVRNLPASGSPKVAEMIAPLLYDPVRAVRMEAASRLAQEPGENRRGPLFESFEPVLKDYEKAMLYTADFAASRHNLANLYRDQGKAELAMEQFNTALEIDNRFIPAKVNLAMMHNRLGQNDRAEELFREIIAQEPHFYEGHYSLGLLLAEREKWEQAADSLATAAQGMPHRPRVHYNLAQIQAYLGHTRQAEQAYLRALALEPGNRDFLMAVADFYLRTGQLNKAQQVTREMKARYPNWAQANQIIEIINKLRKTSSAE